jgi:branched-chain amino acid transport system substrate-binding protein
MPLVEESKVISFVMTPVIKPPSGSYVFGIYPIQEYAYEAELIWLKKKGLTKLGVLASTDTHGAGSVKFLRELAGKHGITLAVENFNLQDVDVTPQLLTLQRGGAQAIMAAMSGKPFAVVAKGMKQLNMKTPLLGLHGGGPTKTSAANSSAWPSSRSALIAPTLKVMVAEQLPDTDENKPPSWSSSRASGRSTRRRATCTPPPAGTRPRWCSRHTPPRARTPRRCATGSRRCAVRGAVCTVTMQPTDHHGCGPEGYVLVQFKNGKFVLEK